MSGLVVAIFEPIQEPTLYLGPASLTPPIKRDQYTNTMLLKINIMLSTYAVIYLCGYITTSYQMTCPPPPAFLEEGDR